MSIDSQACTTARPWAVSELCDCLSGSIDSVLLEEIRVSSGVSFGERIFSRVAIDSRAVTPGALFVALSGARNDGHDYLEAVAASGAVAALVASSRAASDSQLWIDLARKTGIVCVPVSDPLHTLQDFAAFWLRSLGTVRRIGVTGSTGKTTTKELIRCTLSARWRVFASPGNMNSVIGLPLAALALGSDSDIAVFEMAMSEKGEMARLAEIVFPQLAVITNIGTAHIGNIGSQEGIAYEKKQIFSQFTENSIGFVPDSDSWSPYLVSGVAGQFEHFGEKSTLGYQGFESWDDGQVLKFRGERIHLRAAGQHNRLDALAAIQVAEHLGMQASEIRKGMETFSPSFGRSEILHGRITLIQDCYNANPDSMAASIRAFMEMPALRGRHVLILGDMGELGDHSLDFHSAIGTLVAETGADIALFCGKEMQSAFEAACEFEGHDEGGEQHIAWFASRDELAACVDEYVEDGDLVLLKASRSMEMEKLSLVLLGGTTRAGENSPVRK